MFLPNIKLQTFSYFYVVFILLCVFAAKIQWKEMPLFI